MPERWERELRRIRSVEPSDGLWERAEAGPTGPERPSSPDRRGRLVAAVVSIAVIVAAGSGLWIAFGHTSATAPGGGASSGSTLTPPGSTPARTGYVVTLPDTVTAHTGTGATQLVVAVKVTTNLPDGTRAFVRWTYRGGTQDGAGALSVTPVVKLGEIDLEVPWGACDFGEGFSLGVEFRPFYEDYVVPGYPQGSPWPPMQSNEVLQQLGARFENLAGGQVTTVDSSKGPIRQIAVSRTYAWPDTPSDFVPPPCVAPPPTTP